MNASVGTAKSIKYRSILFIDPVGYLEAVCFVFEPIGSVAPVLCPFGKNFQVLFLREIVKMPHYSFESDTRFGSTSTSEVV